MPRLAARPIVLSERQESLLNLHRNRCKIAADQKLRIDIILLAGKGVSNNQICRDLSTTYPTVLKWRNRWQDYQSLLNEFEQGIDQACSDSSLVNKMLEVLSDAARVGRPARISLTQYHAIQTIACCKPTDYGYPIEQWTGDLIAQTAIEQGIIDTISGRYVNILLKKSHSPS